jgi:hypothetical protein
MTEGPATSAVGHGLVLVRGQASASARWLRRGLVPAAAVQLPGWTGVCLTEGGARTRAPYDVGLEVLAARPTPRGRRPSIGLFVVDGCAVVTVQPRGWRADQRWLVWQPGEGVRRTPDLAPLPAGLVLQVAGRPAGVTTADVVAHFREVGGTPLGRLTGLLDLLRLPGADLLRHGPGAAGLAVEAVEPAARGTRAFDALHHDDETPERPA